MAQGSRSDSDSIVGEALVSYNKRPQTFGRGRRCRFGGCLTLLSIYNGGDFCSTHDGFRFVTQPGSKVDDLVATEDWTALQAG